MNRTDKILLEVHAERHRQDKKWGVRNYHPLRWLPILGEEYGEACKAINQGCTDPIAENVDIGKKIIEYREECIQVAAVAVAMVESLDRNKWRKG
jgi:hypothetical protein